ncbi:uncharacterized protein C8Q71DRAFT_10680 [Rhodofomes roseus]|uniref:Uncharacterized protein n=1 Tax=Rhodofomes roseus TaxID=34475 RepID=A0ABQ8KXT8_9APHY|nr:uncharacterized protein C8Q71DRAFT_10680 [Rhodofomes roseus]KAH9843700.1 hypothetical protein C8Q71DRAFT_10680 [Rhodofomes roseus]
MSDAKEQPSQPPALNEQPLFNTLLAPGSSLHPTLLLLLDAAFVALFLVFLSLAILTRGNVHLLVLMVIEVALWGSVKWFVYELQKAQPVEKGDAAPSVELSETAPKPKQE